MVAKKSQKTLAEKTPPHDASSQKEPLKAAEMKGVYSL
jgi:hypothetical protein